MALPEPVPGLVVRYSYLWRREHVAGRDEGQKDRPCAIVAAIRSEADTVRVLLLPVTHSPPDAETVAIEMPAFVKARLGLDEVASWIVLSEFNDFIWPGPDLRPVRGDAKGSVAYGLLPGALFDRIRSAWLQLATTQRSKRVQRTD